MRARRRQTWCSLSDACRSTLFASKHGWPNYSGSVSYSSSGALSHIKVLDMSRILAGPWATQLLADMGAEVIKVERPVVGDDTRKWGPPFTQDTKESAYFMSANRNKKSITCDITKPKGQEIIKRLAAKSDVFIENYKVGDLARYSLDYPSLRKVSPGIVYCSITGFGQDGPLKHETGYDFLMQAKGGLMSITGEPNAPPMKVGVAITDICTGLYASNAILAALVHRGHKEMTTGVKEGQYIDVSLLDVQAATLANQGMNYLVSGKIPQRLGNAHPSIVPYQSFEAKDGYFIIAVGNDAQFQRLCKVIGLEELAQDPKFATNAVRVQNRQELGGIITKQLIQQEKSYWVSRLVEVGVPASNINNIAETFADEQIQYRGMIADIPQRKGNEKESEKQEKEKKRERGKMVGCPLKFSETPVSYHLPAPLLSEHTEEVLKNELGMTSEEIAALRKERII